MTAFAGIITRHPVADQQQQVSRMLVRMQRDLSSTVAEVGFPTSTTRAGWVETAGLLSAAPAWNAERTICAMFLGEEFGVASGYRNAADRSAAASLVAAYSRIGQRALAELNGQFAGVLFDARDNTTTLFNDRYGLGRIYFHEGKDAVYFATESKALLSVLPNTRLLDQRGLAEFIRVGCVMQSRTLFVGISVLPPASIWTFHQGALGTKGRYFDPAVLEAQEPLGAAEYRLQLQDVFARATRRQIENTSPLGMSLTGGLDSRAVIAWANAQPGTLPCYTFGGPYRDCADVKIARRIASICRFPHTTLRIGDDFFRDFGLLAEQAIEYSDATMDISGAVELYVNRLASGISRIRLTGNYGSEIVRSHVAFRPARMDQSCYTPEFQKLLQEAAQTYEAEANCHRLSFIAFKQVPWHHYARRTLESAELTPRTPFLDNELVALVYRAPVELRSSVQPMLDLIAAGKPELAAIGTDRAVRSTGLKALNRIAQGWQEFTVRAEYAYDYGMPHWLAHADGMVSRLHLERLILGRHKFYHFRVWYRDQLRGYVQDRAIAATDDLPGFEFGVVRKLAADHLKGRANHTTMLHKALTLQLMTQSYLRST